jgi:vitamin B12 transporter
MSAHKLSAIARRSRFATPIVAAASSFAFLACPISALADDNVAEDSAAAVTLPPIVIGATRLPTPLDQVASSVTVITEEDLTRSQARSLPDALRAVPGLDLMQIGGPGGATSVFMRGTNANHTKVLLDGIDVSDPSAGGFDLAHLLAGDIERIEVLRGPQSGLYGSDAIGGVINIITKRGEGPARLTLAGEGGSFGTFNQAASLRGAGQRYDYAFNLGHVSSRDVPVTPLDLLPPGRARNDDSYDNLTLSTKLGADLAENLSVGLVARYVDTSLRFTGDDFSTFPSTPAAEQSESDTRQFFSRATGKLSLFEGRFEQTVGIAYTDYRRRDLGPDSEPGFNRGDRIKADWQGDIKLTPDQILTLGLETQRDEIRDSPISAQTDTQAGYIQLQSSFAERLFTTVSLRQDHNDRFGDATTYRIAPALKFPEMGTTLKGSIGSGFKAPSLTQLFVDFPAFNFFGNPNLQPEESTGYDVGFEQNLGSRVQVGATWFHNDIDHLIALSDSGTTNVNIGQAETYGVESFIAYRPWETVNLRADYTYTVAEDATLDRLLLRRPRHKASLSGAWQVTHAFSLSATVLYVGSRIDGNRDFSVPRLEADSYITVNLAGSYAISETVTAFARIENLFDESYQDPTGFLRPGFGVFAGLRVALDVGSLE